MVEQAAHVRTEHVAEAPAVICSSEAAEVVRLDAVDSGVAMEGASARVERLHVNVDVRCWRALI